MRVLDKWKKPNVGQIGECLQAFGQKIGPISNLFCFDTSKFSEPLYIITVRNVVCQTPSPLPQWRPLQRTWRILAECILVF